MYAGYATGDRKLTSSIQQATHTQLYTRRQLLIITVIVRRQKISKVIYELDGRWKTDFTDFPKLKLF